MILSKKWSGLASICKDFVDNVRHPDLKLKKQSVHLMLHLVQCMEEFGPTCSFNTEMYVCSAYDNNLKRV